MSRLITFNEAKQRFAPLATSHVDIGDAIQEAVDRIFDMGRYPGTVKAVTLSHSDFTKEADGYHLYFNEDEYAGLIGFRNESRGWKIVDQTILYRSGINGGDLSLVDCGTITELDGVELEPPLRSYRLPLSFDPAGGPYTALLKLEAPLLDEDTLIPVASLAALKSAVLAVCYENVSDEERATLNWNKFESFMARAEREIEGPKRYYIGFESSLRHKLNQFM